MILDGWGISPRREGNAVFLAGPPGLNKLMQTYPHTLNPVPFVLVDDTRKHTHLKPGILADIAPTILEIMAIEKPEQMTGSSLLTL